MVSTVGIMYINYLELLGISLAVKTFLMDHPGTAFHSLHQQLGEDSLTLANESSKVTLAFDSEEMSLFQLSIFWE